VIELYRKVIRLDALPIWREFTRLTQHRVVATNGCFDLLHRGHVEYLHRAKKLGSLLIVGVNSDEAVRLLKGLSRPINNQRDRAFVLTGLEAVDNVVIFDSTEATQFLDLAMPDVWVKAGDYTLETLNKDEVETVHRHKGRIEILPFVDGYSTTQTISKLNTDGDLDNG
jgi:rfaE bifunctional protein nucleotidyltransferase chain/domain